MVVRKVGSADLRQYYTLFIEIGLLLSLGVLILAFRIPLSDDADFEIVMAEQEVVQMEEVSQTKQETAPPPPPRPTLLVEVANDVILEDTALDLDASLDLNESVENLPLPPPPSAPKEEPVEEESAPEPEIFVVVEEMPDLIGGIQSIQSRIVYPEIARKAGVEGRVIVQFVVDEEGNVRDPVVVRGIGAGCDEEAIRAVNFAKFKPGKQRGRAVRVRMSLPITFRLK